MSRLPSIYINLEDDVNRIVTRLKREKASQVVLVCPRKCQLFSDSINLRLLKKQAELLKKEVFILTMDEKGQMYAKEAGFGLKYLPKGHVPGAFSDVKISRPVNLTSPGTVVKRNLNSVVVTTKPALTSKTEKSIARAPVVQKEEFIDWPTDPATRAVSGGKNSNPEPIKKSGRKLSTVLTALVALSLILVLLAMFVILPRAEVVVHAKTEVITRDWPEILVSSQITQPENETRMALPGTFISETLEITERFQSQGKKEVGNKAYGKVVIYNFTRAPLNLKANTTSLAIGGKTYVLAEDLTGIKPTEYKNEATKEIDPESLSPAVEVIASAGGESFNVPAGTRMEITNQVFGSKPQFLYAKTESAITGGTSRYLSLISELDITNAQNSLAEKLVSQYREQAKAKNLVILDKTYILEPLSFTTDKPAGSESPSFEAHLKVKFTAMAFNGGQMKELIKGRIERTLSTNKLLDFSNDNQMSLKLKSVDFLNQQAVFSAHFEGKIIHNVDISEMNRQLRGKSKTDVQEMLGSRPEIQTIDITLTPSWQDNFPWFAGKIVIKKLE